MTGIQRKTFSVADLMMATGAVSICLAVASWVFRSEFLNSTNYLPAILPLDLPVIEIGMAFALSILPLLLIIAALLFCSSPRPWIPFIYLGLFPVGFTIPESAVVRFLIVLLVLSVASFIETKVRVVDARSIYTSLLCCGITLAYYFMTIAIMMIASC